MQLDHIDGGVVFRDAFIDDPRAFVGQSGQQLGLNLLLRIGCAGDAIVARICCDQVSDGGVHLRCAITVFVEIPTLAHALTGTAHVANLIRDRDIAFAWRAGRVLAAAVGLRDLQSAHVLRFKRAHRHAKGAHRIVDLFGQGAIGQHILRRTAIGRQHPVADKAVANP